MTGMDRALMGRAKKNATARIAKRRKKAAKSIHGKVGKKPATKNC